MQTITSETSTVINDKRRINLHIIQDLWILVRFVCHNNACFINSIKLCRLIHEQINRETRDTSQNKVKQTGTLNLLDSAIGCIFVCILCLIKSRKQLVDIHIFCMLYVPFLAN